MTKKWIILIAGSLIAGSLMGCTTDIAGKSKDTAPTPPGTVKTPIDYTALWNEAVAHLTKAHSYSLQTSSVRAYMSERDGVERRIYGECKEDIQVILNPLQVANETKYRYDPDGAFVAETIYFYQKGDRCHQRIVEGDGGGTSMNISRDEAFPDSSDILNTLAGYYPAAVFVEEKDGLARYALKHPEGYRMKSAAMFADMGMLYMQEDAAAAIEAYAKEHYPEAAPIVFTIDVDINSGYLRQVTVDDAAYMLSIWAAVEDAALDSGAKPEELARYTVLPENGTTYLFSKWNAIAKINLPE